jgi:hypothetical protein
MGEGMPAFLLFSQLRRCLLRDRADLLEERDELALARELLDLVEPADRGPVDHNVGHSLLTGQLEEPPAEIFMRRSRFFFCCLMIPSLWRTHMWIS